MNAPVDQNTAAGLLLGRESTTQPRNAAEAAERAVDMIKLAELAGCIQSFDHFNRLLIPVADTDVEQLSLLFGFRSHFAGEGIADRDRLFAQNVLAGTQSIHGDRVVRIVRSQHPDGFHFRVLQRDVVVGDCLFAAEIPDCFFCLFGNQIAGIFHPHVIHFGKSRKMRILCNSSASDDRNAMFFHRIILFFQDFADSSAICIISSNPGFVFIRYNLLV